GLDTQYVARRPEPPPKPLPLADRVGRRPAMLPDPRPIGIEERPRHGLPACSRPQSVAVIAARDEADLVALGLVGRHEVQRASRRADLGLRQLAEWEPRVLEL